MDDELKRIEEILDKTIRPALMADGGNLEIVSFDGKILKISYHGACGHCPSAKYGTLNMIKAILARDYDKDVEVEVVD